jgi:hypothetical protein
MRKLLNDGSCSYMKNHRTGVFSDSEKKGRAFGPTSYFFRLPIRLFSCSWYTSRKNVAIATSLLKMWRYTAFVKLNENIDVPRYQSCILANYVITLNVFDLSIGFARLSGCVDGTSFTQAVCCSKFVSTYMINR